MKVTPLEIKQKQFEKKTFGGIDKDEVQAFLNSLSLAWEKMLEDNATMKSRLDYSEKEVAKLREVESSLYKTLKAAEETSEKTLAQANQQAQLTVSEAKLKAETMIQDAKWKASKAMEQAEEYAKKCYDQMVSDVKVLERDLHSIENMKDSFLSDIRIIANDLLEKANKADQKSAKIQFKVPPAPNINFERPVFESKELDQSVENQLQESHELLNSASSEVEGKSILETSSLIAEEISFQKTISKSESPKPVEIQPDEPEKPIFGGSFFDRI